MSMWMLVGSASVFITSLILPICEIGGYVLIEERRSEQERLEARRPNREARGERQRPRSDRPAIDGLTYVRVSSALHADEAAAEGLLLEKAENEINKDELTTYKKMFEEVRQALVVGRLVINTADEKYDFLCPINLTLMWDPVVASDGNTYEREAIEKVLKENKNPTSPKSRELLKQFLTQNRTVKSMIENFVRESYEELQCVSGPEEKKSEESIETAFFLEQPPTSYSGLSLC